MINVKPLKKFGQIKKGDIIIFEDAAGRIFHKTVKIVQITETDGEEIIFNVKKNRFFNVGMYLKNGSWVKDCKVIKGGVKL